MTFLYILAAILMLGIMVTVHEAGHFFAARLTGIPVKEFAIGFGPQLLTWKSKKHETQFFLRLIPAGGYCMFYGEDDVEEKEKDDPRALGNFPVWRRFLTVLMGPVMNFFLALVVAAALFGVVGEDTGGEFGYAVVQSVREDSPAAQSGMMVNDVLITVNGADASGLAPADASGGTGYMLSTLVNGYQPGDDPLTIGVLRGEETLTLTLTPEFDAAEGRYLMGIQTAIQYTPAYAAVGPIRAVQLGAGFCVEAGGAILGALGDLVTTGAGFEESAGPVGIVQLIAEETQRSAENSALEAFITYGRLLVLISVNLGLFNLLPIPGLDGSRLIFLLVEGVRRKPVPRRVEAYVHTAGFVLLMGLMLMFTYKDILRIFR